MRREAILIAAGISAEYACDAAGADETKALPRPIPWTDLYAYMVRREFPPVAVLRAKLDEWAGPLPEHEQETLFLRVFRIVAKELEGLADETPWPVRTDAEIIAELKGEPADEGRQDDEAGEAQAAGAADELAATGPAGAGADAPADAAMAGADGGDGAADTAGPAPDVAEAAADLVDEAAGDKPVKKRRA